MRVAISQVKPHADRAVAGPGLRLGRQHRRADGGLALRAEDARRHRPAGHRHRDAERSATAPPPCSTSAPTSTARRAPAAVRGHGQRAGVRASTARTSPTRRPAQHRRRSDQGQRDRSSRPASCCARRPAAGDRQLLRQRRRQRHLQGHDRHRRLRRLRRQRRAEDQPKGWRRCSSSFIKEEFTRNAADQAGGARRAAGAERASRRASTTAATTARRCWACAAWCSRATARPTRSPSSRRLNRAYDAARNDLLDRVQRPHSRHAAPPCRRPRRRSTSLRHRGLTDAPHDIASTRYSRITGTGSYLPPERVTNDDLAARLAPGRHRDLRRMDRRAHRHPRAPLRRARRHLQRPRPSKPRGARSKPPTATPSDDRPDHRRHLDAGHGVPVGRLHPAAQARHRRLRRVRRAGGVLAASSTR